MKTYSVFEHLLEINQESASELINIYHGLPGKSSSLIFPKLRGTQKLRVSEQELRFAMTSSMDRSPVHFLEYSVETPTENPYSFRGSIPRSGATDLTLYSGGKKLINIEFKAHNPSGDTFNKDIEKLLLEPYYGAWLHILENINSATIKSIFNKLINAFNTINQLPKKPLYLSFLVLQKKILISRKGKDDDLINFNPGKILDLNYSEIKTFIDSKEVNKQIRDWHLNKY